MDKARASEVQPAVLDEGLGRSLCAEPTQTASAPQPHLVLLLVQSTHVALQGSCHPLEQLLVHFGQQCVCGGTVSRKVMGK